MDSQFQLLNQGRPNSPLVNSANAGKNPNLSNSRRTGLCFLLVVISIAIFEYLGYAYVLLLPLLWPKPDKIGLLVTILFHIVFLLFVGAFIQCVSTDPGTVPTMWGFRVGEDAKRRRYCKVCQLWKPDRTHHCSACGRCVLNMDHHCPWINNCVGFHNRKFFIQLLIYSQACLYFIIFQGIIYLIEQYINYWPYKPNGEDFFFNESLNTIKSIIVIFLLIFAVPLALALLPFTRFHFSLIARNSTTIESIDSQNREYARYDLGPSRNLQQVFGKYFIFWFFPCHNKQTRPLGDGVRWSMRCETFHEDVELGNKNKDSLLNKSNQITGNYYVSK